MSTWKHKLGAFFASLSLCLLLLLLGEVSCRLFMNINFRRTSRDFVVTDPAGAILANRPNAHGISFGADVYSDAYGFRINPQREEKPQNTAVLFLGDSVAFGVGVPEEKTFVGMFREKNPGIAVYNSAVVGYSIPDYRRVVSDFIPQHPEVMTVYLFYCLNDFHEAAEINTNPENQGFWRELKLQAASLISATNEFFGAHSKFYVYLTGKLIDPSDKYFQSDYNTYLVDDQKFDRIIQPLSEIGKDLKNKNIKFVVFINPYEKQLRTGKDEDRLPQKKLESYFTAHNITYVDTFQNFTGIKSNEGFLFEDPEHLSEKGHQIVFAELEKSWTALQK